MDAASLTLNHAALAPATLLSTIYPQTLFSTPPRQPPRPVSSTRRSKYSGIVTSSEISCSGVCLHLLLRVKVVLLALCMLVPFLFCPSCDRNRLGLVVVIILVPHICDWMRWIRCVRACEIAERTLRNLRLPAPSRSSSLTCVPRVRTYSVLTGYGKN